MGNSRSILETFSKKYDAHRAADMRLLEAIIDNLKLNKTMNILDFGCGTGNYLEALQSKGYRNLFGLDPSKNMRDTAFKKTNVIIRDGSHLNIPYEDNFFDAVILIAVIHFVEDIKSLFDGLQRICKKGALVFIATQSYKQIERRFYNKYFPSLVKIDKTRYHEIEKIISTAEQSGFSLRTNQDFLSCTDMMIDEKYFSLVQNKAFFIFELLPSKEFEKGLSLFRKDMKNGNFIAKFAGWTIITLQKI
jgi:ubiquinone/menaquinone biosynthesis C-methylase UbiE